MAPRKDKWDILMRILPHIVWTVYLIRVFSVPSHLLSKGRQIMKRVLIGSLSVLAIVVGTEAANAQADINPNIYPPYRGAPVAQQPWEWYSTPGPLRRGSQCVADVDPGRGYGFMKDCPAPQASAAPRTSRVAHRHHRKSVYR
jgi:hypothetical protein